MRVALEQVSPGARMPIDNASRESAAEDQSSPGVLLARMRAGDREAAAQFMHHYGPLIRSRVRDKLGTQLRRVMDSEDVLSTVARRLDGMIAEGRMRAETEPELWSLVQSVANHALSESLRATRADREALRGVSRGSFDHLPDIGEDERAAIALRSVENDADRRMVALWMRGASLASIGRSIGATPASVRMRWNRLMRTLRKLARKESR